MPPPSRNRKNNGLGRAIINKKAKEASEPRDSLLHTTDQPNLHSVTQERDLDEFLNTAELAATDFTAEKQNVTVISTPTSGSGHHNTFLLTHEEEVEVERKQALNKDRLRVPRRPPWDKSTTPAQLERQERDAFLAWRRDLALLAESDPTLLLTPYERNLNVWRQLWRVLERSQLVVQIVDGRNPGVFWARDLEPYVRELGAKEVRDRSGGEKEGEGKRLLVLVNKADLLDEEQRRAWADYFDSQGIRYAFFSALNAAELLEEAQRLREQREELLHGEGEGESEGEGEGSDSDEDVAEPADAEEVVRQARGLSVDPERVAAAVGELRIEDGEESEEEEGEEEWEDDEEPVEEEPIRPREDEDRRTRVLNIVELEQLFIDEAPDLSYLPPTHKLTVGLVGYPNVGKSSTLNALLGAHRVSVSATPGKTKHFQTHHLGSALILCDCPGLVFPQFANTRAALVCDGVLGVDEMREWRAPIELVCRRVPQGVLEGVYGIRIETRPAEEGGDGVPTAEELLTAYAVNRGFTRGASHGGNPDESRAARLILKDYINAKILYCHPPPNVDSDTFNAFSRARQLAYASTLRRRVAGAEQGKVPGAPPSSRIAALDRGFFATPAVNARPTVMGHRAGAGELEGRVKAFPHQKGTADDGTALSGRKARLAAVAAGLGGAAAGGDKKHFKKRREKKRSGKGYEDF